MAGGDATGSSIGPSIGPSIKALALAVGFDLAGVTHAVPGPHSGYLREWLARGYGGPPEGPLSYVARRADERVDPGTLFEGARSVVAVALFHGESGSEGAGSGAAGAAGRSFGRVARYARGDDYHDVMSDRLRALACGVELLAGRAVESRYWVDTGPVLEREVAAQAGLGWIGKNTMLIHPRLGSFLLLGVLVTDIDLGAEGVDAPEPDHCGSCRLCLDACPTAAFPEPFRLDATRCIAYTTIEDPGAIPTSLRSQHRDNLFGCDICQDVCPWNQPKRVPVPGDPLGLHARLASRDELRRPALAWVLGLDEDAWQRATRGSAMRRSRRRGLLRNALVAAGNSGDATLKPLVEDHARSDDPLLSEHARWALSQLDGPSSTRPGLAPRRV